MEKSKSWKEEESLPESHSESFVQSFTDNKES